MAVATETSPVESQHIDKHNQVPVDSHTNDHVAYSGEEPRFMGLRGKGLSLMISTIATTGFLLFGYDQGVMSGIITAEPFNAYFPETKDDSVYQGFVTAIYEAGCLVGALLILGIADKIGRRKAVSSRQISHSETDRVLTLD
jgi:MFS family permease